MHNTSERFSLFCPPQCKIRALPSNVENVR